MATVNDGTYRISMQGTDFLSLSFDDFVTLMPEGEAKQWELRRTGDGGYTIRQAGTDRYVGYDGDTPESSMTMPLSTQPRTWTITDATNPDGPEGVSITAPGTDLSLCSSLLRVYPPRVALLSPEYARGQLWTLHPA